MIVGHAVSILVDAQPKTHLSDSLWRYYGTVQGGRIKQVSKIPWFPELRRQKEHPYIFEGQTIANHVDFLPKSNPPTIPYIISRYNGWFQTIYPTLTPNF
jgi:hypothetical protein